MRRLEILGYPKHKCAQDQYVPGLGSCATTCYRLTGTVECEREQTHRAALWGWKMAARSLFETEATVLIATDFAGVYQVYLYQIAERNNAVKIWAAIMSIPMVLFSAFGLVSEVNLTTKDLTELIAKVPEVFFLLCIVVGLTGIIPYMRFLASHGQSYKAIRYLNNFRRLYSLVFREEPVMMMWQTRIEVDPDKPVEVDSLFHWVNWTTLIIALVNMSYVVLSAIKLTTFPDIFTAAGFLTLFAFFSGIVILLWIHLSIYRSEKKATDTTRRYPAADINISLPPLNS